VALESRGLIHRQANGWLPGPSPSAANASRDDPQLVLV
jgi:hypothetical protein